MPINKKNTPYCWIPGSAPDSCALGRMTATFKRPREAIAPLQAALRGSLEGGNLYITRADVHERLALAWQAAGNADSAAVHFRGLVRTWQHADSVLVPRRIAAEAALAQLAGH